MTAGAPTIGGLDRLRATILEIVGSSGSFTRDISTVTTTTSAGSISGTDYAYYCNGTFTITLPTAVSNKNRYTIVNIGAGTVTIGTTSSQTIGSPLISPATTLNIPTASEAIELLSDNANWQVI